MVVYALIWIKLPTALSLLAKNSPSSSRLWLHSNYTADWNEPALGGGRGRDTPPAHPSWLSHCCPWDTETSGVFWTCGWITLFLRLHKTSQCCLLRKTSERSKPYTVHRFQQHSSILKHFKQIPTVCSHCWQAAEQLLFSCSHSLLGSALIPTWEDIKQEVFNTKSCK